LALQTRVRGISASNFIMPFDDRQLEHVIHLYFMLFLLEFKMLSAVLKSAVPFFLLKPLQNASKFHIIIVSDI
jgi:hypothetical protein